MRYLKIIVVAILFVGCEEYFNPGTDEQEPAYIFSGLVTDQPGPYRVKITRTKGYDSNDIVDEIITNARVRIVCSDGKSYNLIIDNTGYYLSDSASFIGEVGKSYMLLV